MIFHSTTLQGVYLIEPERIDDHRGFFARTWCAEEFEAHGLSTQTAQCSISYNKNRGTLRGMHFQIDPKAEIKVVRCTAGAIYDVLLDLRMESPSHLKWEAFELSSENRKLLYVPEGIAHGFQTLEDHTEVFYQISEFYSPEHSRGVLWNDEAFGIEWPIADPIVSDKDRSYPSYHSAP
ncbi:MAG: dTDP-4-dehydrorhamnose 3,5-epimerase [Nitrospinaceae bacterium]|nr:dTDP-4-dehydrorhamnose 3,5-epimerase [Nitrospinaceae bacterium]NIR56555.1 dTDP-4-dehydrorhamnose 3,5-epimerase [Nitrospinaceae bacterium]NIS87014.1 dTDP-4-dehydrorhamnose 3,5-epimerase [Nitrospinaceae bacterium]NIT83856.1 dTDP-4-dehydrorhamnose 3,5-epimerase [Nitrospinaceae bacterium]NIU46064.1 dTDP-4-dehydrorhamnose 3,5-epimerase [Nitrospinaceae bacterium]